MAEKEHQFVCEGPKEAPHKLVDLIILSRFGTAPEVPKCPECGSRMGKVYTAPVVNWNPRWEHLHGD